MAKYKIKNPKFFIKYLSAIGNIAYEGFLLLDDKITIKAFDPSRIAVFEFTMGNDIVDVDEECDEKVGVCFDDLKKIAERLKTTESLALEYDYHAQIVKFIGRVKSRKKTFSLGQRDIDYKEVGLDNLLGLPLNVVFRVNGKDLSDAIKDCGLFAEIATFETKDGKLIVSSIGQSGSCSVEIKTESEIFTNETASYSLTFLTEILKPMVGSEITVLYSSNYPVMIYDKISEQSYMRWFLAPRVNDDD